MRCSSREVMSFYIKSNYSSHTKLKKTTSEIGEKKTKKKLLNTKKMQQKLKVRFDWDVND